MIIYNYVEQRICSYGGDIIVVTREEVVIKWLDYVYAHDRYIVPALQIGINGWLVYSNLHMLYTGLGQSEVLRQLRKWSHYDEIILAQNYTPRDVRTPFKLADPPISLHVNRKVLKKVALLLNLKCDVMSMVARKLLTK